MKSFVGNHEPQVYPNTCQETMVLSCMFLEKKFTTKFFSFLTWYGEKMYMALYQSIIIHDLTCKLYLIL